MVLSSIIGKVFACCKRIPAIPIFTQQQLFFEYGITMARHALISERRFHLIMKRQEEMRWLAEYQPAMLATRDEAPTISRPSTLYCEKLGRDMHFMSLAERHVCLLSLYHPRVFDIHEQHMLSMFDAPHPLSHHPDARELSLPPLAGTVSITEKLGMLSDHPIVHLTAPDNPGSPLRHAFPYLGDLLLFLKDDQGPYCVNWSVKPRKADFYARSRRKQPRQSITLTSGQPSLDMRHLLEQRYFADAQIPTHFVATEDLPVDLIYNLNALCARAQRKSSLPYDVEEELIHQFQKIVGTTATVLSMLPPWTVRFKFDRVDCLSTLYKAVWNRRVRLDLYKPLLVDKPLRAERVDPLLEYAHLFRR
ncbi:hypothetical protein D7I39_03085 [Allopusillimonas ginsengisoli]|nr:hypothetical protein D7I39_03085 [Allopusillimonas ginsengisoli]